MSEAKRMPTVDLNLQNSLRRLRNTPSYFFLIWRWSMWFYALIIVIQYQPIRTDPQSLRIATILLIISALQLTVGTLYAPVVQILLPHLPHTDFLRLPQTSLTEEEEPDILSPLIMTRNRYWNIAIYIIDTIICGLLLYFGGALFVTPPFGSGSIFYRYALSTVFGAALAYRYKGALFSASGYIFFVLLGILVPAPGAQQHYVSNVIDIAGSLVDAPVAALLAAYVASLLANYARSKKEIQYNVRRQQALRSVAESIVREAHNRDQLLEKSVEQICLGGRFQRVILVHAGFTDDESETASQIDTDHCIVIDIAEAPLPARNPFYLTQVLQNRTKFLFFQPADSSSLQELGMAYLYLPFFKDGVLQMVLGVESRRSTPFDSEQELFLTTAGSQLLIALDNIRLTEQTIQLAANAERGRIAREIHDGIAQLLYMLSLQTEACVEQAHRIAEASEEDTELILPLSQRLETLVRISKQALWETRHYMFTLRPLMSGSTTLTEMVTNQLREFETISSLSVQFLVTGQENEQQEDQKRRHREAKIGTAIFRIVQEALTNSYKHAQATQIMVHLHFDAKSIIVEISDNGRGLPLEDTISKEMQQIYSGHGLGGMRERAEELGGTFEITKSAIGGVMIRVQIPRVQNSTTLSTLP